MSKTTDAYIMHMEMYRRPGFLRPARKEDDNTTRIELVMCPTCIGECVVGTEEEWCPTCNGEGFQLVQEK